MLNKISKLTMQLQTLFRYSW